MSLVNFARHLVDLSSMNCSPTVVMPDGVEPKTPFLISLATEITKLDPRPVRFDWLFVANGAAGLLAMRMILWRAKRMGTQLSRASRSTSLQVTAALARPNYPQSLVIGLANDQVQLPAWSKAVRLEMA